MIDSSFIKYQRSLILTTQKIPSVNTVLNLTGGQSSMISPAKKYRHD